MSTTSRRSRNASFKTPMSTPKRFLHCIACGTLMKERPYALCAECYRVSGTLPKAWFTCFIRHAEREATQHSYRNDPRFEHACQVYARRRRRAERAEALGTLLTPMRVCELSDPRNRPAHEEYDGIGPYDLADVLDAQQGRAALPKSERSVHRELSEAEIARWDARVDRWAAARGISLVAEPEPEIRPWGFAIDVDGVLVWTDDLVLD